VGSLGSYVYTAKSDALAVHLYAASEADLEVGGAKVKVAQDTAYPWDGDVRITLSPEQPATFTLHLRIPGWCQSAALSVNGGPVDLQAVTTDGYAAIHREWRAGDAIRLFLTMSPERLYAHPLATENGGRVSIKRGPLVYCAEEVDNGALPQLLSLAPDATFAAEFRPDLLGGTTILTGPATVTVTEGWEGAIYRGSPPATRPGTVTLVPYHLWANRAAGGMLVWLREG
jgi:hypothetical protein